MGKGGFGNVYKIEYENKMVFAVKTFKSENDLNQELNNY